MNCQATSYSITRYVQCDFRVFSPEQILQSICKASGISLLTLVSKTHEREVAEYRFIAMFWMKRSSGLKLKQIGYLLNRHHTTVIYGLLVHDELEANDKQYREKVKRVKEQLLREEVAA